MRLENVCASCLGDSDLRRWIRDVKGPRGCDACGGFDSPTAPFDDLCEHITECLKRYWGFAVDSLPYESAEGGYQGATWDTYDLLFDEAGLDLPRDTDNGLLRELLHGLPDEAWCEYDWLTLDRDRALATSWERFCETIKYRRRFFFHSDGKDDRDSYSAASLLKAIARASERMGLIGTVKEGTALWRCRPDVKRNDPITAGSFGPPPREFALQSNRMNPAGISMMYVASTTRTALLETRVNQGRIGKWTSARDLRVLDLRRPPGLAGVFSPMDREDRLTLKFLYFFAQDIMMPVERDQRVHVDYLPSQVISEFLRDFKFKGGRLDGIAYGSTVCPAGWNVALFADLVDLGLEDGWCLRQKPKPWLKFEKAVWAKVASS